MLQQSTKNGLGHRQGTWQDRVELVVSKTHWASELDGYGSTVASSEAKAGGG